MTALPLLLVLVASTPAAGASGTAARAPGAAGPARSAPSSAPSSAPPTRADLQRTLASFERSAVEVEGPGGRGPGIAVGAGGEVLTSTDYVGPEGAVVWRGEARQEARVVLVDPDTRLAVVRVEPGAEATPPAVPVRLLEQVPSETWLIAVPAFKGQRYPVRVRASGAGPLAPSPHFTVAQALPPGAPLFDGAGRLVGLVVRAEGRRRRLALPLAALARRLAESR